ncbi:importin subunit alpha-4 [Vigna angularis]|uniref:importin subunit alpha-4 n=1 Tax=Phaseolus angularis TaxID=3914 RepID=UPI0022B2B537|nr:importin subunit alpha-4 [Vigna angularis]
MSLRPSSSSGSPSNTRRKIYKTGIDAEDSRRRREKDLVAVRKIKRQTALVKKREQRIFRKLLDAIPEMVKRVTDEYPDKQLETYGHFRTFVTPGEPALPVDNLVKKGILPLFLELLSRDDAPYLQTEILWVISDFVSTSFQHKSAVVEIGFVPHLINLFSSTHDDTKEEVKSSAIWILGGIANGCPDFRDLILSHGALIILLSQLEPQSSMSIVRAATWSLSVLLRGMPPVDFEQYVSEKWLDPCQVKIALPALQRLIHATDEDVLTDTCWTLAYLSESHMDNIQAIIELGVCPKLVQLLQYPSDGVILPALLALGNIAVGGGAHTQVERMFHIIVILWGRGISVCRA